MSGSVEEWLGLALWLAGAGHFLVLGASFQVPFRLHWKEDLAKLTPFNRKLMWVHGGFAIYTIMAFGVLSLVLHEEIMQGDRAALALSFFIGFYWLLRILVDFTYYSHRDWPSGAAFRVGHVLLTTLFVFLSASFLSVPLWHWLGASRV
jgi:hypothetical protein